MLGWQGGLPIQDGRSERLAEGCAGEQQSSASERSKKMAKDIEALLALMEMCDHCRQAVRCRTRDRAIELASKMDEVVPRYLEAFKAAYGNWRDAQKGNIFSVFAVSTATTQTRDSHPSHPSHSIFSVFAVSTATIPRHAIPILLILPTPILFIQAKKEAVSLPNPCPVHR